MDTRYIRPEDLKSSFKTLNPSLAVTTGHYEIKARCEVRDLDWNHMDQLHRPALHKTYQESLRLVTGRSFELSLTRVSLGGFKFFILVTNIQLGPGLFYQTYSLFNLFYIHCIIQMTPLSERDRKNGDVSLLSSEWHIVSHRWLKFLHAPLNRRLYRINEVQNKDDTPVRIRRADLRRRGYRFGSDNPDFINSNVLIDNVTPPQLVGIYRISLKGIIETGLNRVWAGPIELLVRKNGNQGITVWPAVCPHEGGPIALGKVCNGMILCPWHNLKQPGATLNSVRTQEFLGGLQLSLEGDELVVQRQDLKTLAAQSTDIKLPTLL